ncbi:hypothetical protein HGG75_00485 [Ochrobactrum pseudogrignonense]|nr:hypothetical protein [Brucella pseudogrignonensis]
MKLFEPMLIHEPKIAPREHTSPIQPFTHMQSPVTEWVAGYIVGICRQKGFDPILSEQEEFIVKKIIIASIALRGWRLACCSTNGQLEW